MTNPSNAVGTNGAYGGRTSADALNDVLGAFKGAGVLSGWNVRADSGMSVLVGGQSGVRDVAVAEDQLGDRTTVNNRLGSPINITLASSSPSTARVDSIVLYVNKPASVSTTTIDNPEACGIIAVNGTTVAPSEADIRSAITADGGTGATAYYVVIADATIPASATVITNSNITNYSGKFITGSSLEDSAVSNKQIADGAITSAKVAADGYRRTQPSGLTDANNLTDTGLYYLTEIHQNAPDPNSQIYQAIVIVASGYGHQIFINLWSNAIYIRGCYDGSWGAWQQLHS